MGMHTVYSAWIMFAYSAPINQADSLEKFAELVKTLYACITANSKSSLMRFTRVALTAVWTWVFVCMHKWCTHKYSHPRQISHWQQDLNFTLSACLTAGMPSPVLVFFSSSRCYDKTNRLQVHSSHRYSCYERVCDLVISLTSFSPGRVQLIVALRCR